MRRTWEGRGFSHAESQLLRFVIPSEPAAAGESRDLGLALADGREPKADSFTVPTSPLSCPKHSGTWLHIQKSSSATRTFAAPSHAPPGPKFVQAPHRPATAVWPRATLPHRAAAPPTHSAYRARPTGSRPPPSPRWPEL